MFNFSSETRMKLTDILLLSWLKIIYLHTNYFYLTDKQKINRFLVFTAAFFGLQVPPAPLCVSTGSVG